MFAFVAAVFYFQVALGDNTFSKSDYGPYVADVVRVYDGDTLTAHIHIFPGMTYKRSVRLYGIDTPEIRGKCVAEKVKAIEARDALIELIGDDRIVLVNVIEGKYAGRVVAEVLTGEGVSVGRTLIELGLARPYDGKGRRQSWCE